MGVRRLRTSVFYRAFITLSINGPRFRYKCLLYFYQQDMWGWIHAHADYLPLIQVLLSAMNTSVIERQYFRREQRSHECHPRTLLDFSVWCNRLDIVQLLVSAGANVNCSSGYPVRVAAYLDSTCILECLLSAGVDMNTYYIHTRGIRGVTALEVALMTRNKKTARLLIQEGAVYSDNSGMLDDFAREFYLRLINK